MRIAVVGSGGHAKVVADAVLAQGHEFSGFFGEDSSRWGQTVLGYPILGPIKGWQQQSIEALVVGIGDNLARKVVFNQLKSAGAKLITVVHPRATLGKGVALGEGAVVLANVVVNSDSQIGPNCILNTACTVDHDCIVSAHVHVAPGVNITGHVKLGEGTFVGTGAKIIPRILVGDWAIIGAGAVVVRNVDDGAKVIGVPARAIRQR
jgi:sugar O-acyltransferase (sialic acid O-acetyltransferase NeuD family)